MDSRTEGSRPARRPRGLGATHSSRSPLVLAVCHLPPPTHGMSVASADFVERLRVAAGGAVEVVDIAEGHALGVRHHLVRARRLAQAMRRVAALRRDPPALYTSCDAGLGMHGSTLVVGLARWFGLPIFIHHHSCDYLRAPTRRFRVLLRVAGRDATHLVGCQTMGDQLVAAYGGKHRVIVLPIAYAVDPGPDRSLEEPPSRRDEDSAGDRPIVVGQISNLSEAKGLRRVFDLAEALRYAGSDARVLLAGPPATAADRQLLESLLEEATGTSRHLGPLYGSDREQFFANVDVFVFASTYRNESFGIVVAEALARGVPVVGYRVGCLDDDLVGPAGCLVSQGEPFIEPMVRWIRQELHRIDRRAVAERTRAILATARETADDVAAAIVTTSADRSDRTRW